MEKEMKKLIFLIAFMPMLASATNSSTLVCFQLQNPAADLFSATTVNYQVYDTDTNNTVLNLTLDRLSQNPGEFNQMAVSYGIGQNSILEVIFTLDTQSGKYSASSLETQVPVVNLIENPTQSTARNASCFNLMAQ
jgi:hypothetical protein